jgi:membrane-associated protease RseP (regulator of RpoE activity)
MAIRLKGPVAGLSADRPAEPQRRAAVSAGLWFVLLFTGLVGLGAGLGRLAEAGFARQQPLWPPVAGAAAAADRARASLGPLGLTGVRLEPMLAARLGLPAGAHGVLVTSLSADGPAARAGLRVGDVAIALNGIPLRDPRDLAAALPARGLRGYGLAVQREPSGRLASLRLQPVAAPAPGRRSP